MKDLLKILFFSLILIHHSVIKAQQAIQFSQYIFSGLSLNPGYAGYKENLNLNMTYRSQWTGLSGAPATLSVSVDGVSKNKSLGFGFSVLQDNLGPQSTLSALVSFAYRLKLSINSRLSFGVTSGIDQYKLDNSKLITIDPEQNIGSLVTTKVRPDLQFGLFFASEHFFTGISATDLLAGFNNFDPTYLVIKREKYFYFHLGGIFPLNSSISLKPSFLIKEDFKAPANLDLNTFLIFNNKFWLGLSLRTAFNAFNSKFLQTNLNSSDAASIMVEYFPNRSLRIGYSFDYTTSPLQQVSSGSHEISLGYIFHTPNYPMLSPRLF